MAAARAFGILNGQNQVNGNQFVGKNVQSLKGNETRSGTAFALKDLTNSNKAQQRTVVVHQDGKGKSSNTQGGKHLKSATNSIVQKIGLKNEQAAPRKPSNSSTYDIFSPQCAEYAWAQASCLRDDLLEQMIDFNGVPCEIKRKPLPPVRPDPLDLPDLDDDLWSADKFRPLKEHRFASVKPLDLPADDFPLVDIQDLEFMF